MKRQNIRKLFLATLFVAISILIIIRYEIRANLKEFDQTLKQLEATATQLETVVFPEKEQNFHVWKTIESGTYKNTNAIRKASISNGFSIEYWADDILKKISVSQEKTRLELVLISAAELGFSDWVTYKDIYERAQELGLKFLPAEAGPQLRLQYKNQPPNEWLHIAMEPISDSNGDPTIFDIMSNNQHAHNNDLGLQLCSSSVRHDVLWSPSSKWVFAKN